MSPRLTFPNIPAMHRQSVRRLGPRAALRFPQCGLYRDLSWNTYRRQADGAARSLVAAGIEPGDRLGLLAENRHEWLVCDLAMLSAGAVTVPLHAPLSAAQVEYQFGHSGCRAAFVSNQAQADKVLEVLPALPDLELLVSFEPVKVAGRIPHYTWSEWLHQASGGERQASLQAEIARREAALTADSPATVIYTSGTTGNPKGVMLTHGNLVSNAEAMAQVNPPAADDVLLSWLPYSHIYARTVDHYYSVLTGGVLCLAESMETVLAAIRAVQPTWMTAVPRFYEKVWSAVAQLEPEERRARLGELFGPRIRRLTSGGAPLPRQIADGFFEAGQKLFEGYGLTESSPVISFNHEAAFKLGSVGRPIPGVEVRIAEDGEILTRGPHVMAGYWKNAAATQETIQDGWLYTGDVGRLDDEGFLFITDRKKDLIITSAGKNIAPSVLERLLAADAYIDQAAVYGDGRQFVSALVVPNFEMLERKALELNCRIEVRDEFLVTPALLNFLAERVATTMQAVSQPERVKKFLVLGRPFQLAAEELTASMKLRRRFVVAKFQRQLDALYVEGSTGERLDA